jgi:Beta protein
MSSHDTYVPILRARGGEFEAVARLTDDVKDRLLPLIEIPRFAPDFRSGKVGESWSQYLSRKTKYIIGTWGAFRPLFLDSFDTDEEARTENGRLPIVVAHEYMRTSGSNGNNAIPVTMLDRATEYQDAIASIVAQDNRGVCIRLLRTDIRDVRTLGNSLRDLLRRLGALQKSSYLLVDFREVSADQTDSNVEMAASVLDGLTEVELWRAVIVSAGRMPETLQKLAPSGKDSLIDRAEISMWDKLAEMDVRRKPTFGDYGVVNPKGQYIPTGEPITAAPTIRYTDDANWIILRGQSTRKDASGFEQFRTLSERLVRRAEYRNSSFAWGDRYISECANSRTDGPGNLKKWVAVCTNHHLTLVSRQMSSGYVSNAIR